jgi:uncharacterized OsmC-like protein
MTDADLLPPGADPDKPLIGIRQVKATNDASARSVMTVRGHELIADEPTGADTGPTPLEMALSSLLGCEGVIINRCAEALKFLYSKVAIAGDGEVDGRGSRGVRGVRPYFTKVNLVIRIHSNEAPERLEKLRKNVETRCPVMNLFVAADVEVTADWELVAV